MMESLIKLWNQQASLVWWQALMLGAFCLLTNGVLCTVNWYIRRETILECGYKRSRLKRIRKAMKQWNWEEKILLRRLASEATEYSPMVPISMFLLYLNALCGMIAVVGCIGVIVTLGAGWSVVFAFYPGPAVLFFSTAVTFLPDLIWVPSERKRYGLGRKKK